MIKAVRHTGIVVRDLKKSTQFYSALGFIEHGRAIEEGDFIESVVCLKDVKVEWVKLKSPDGCLIELLQYHSHPKQKEIVRQQSNQLGHSHLALSVDNIDTVCKEIEKMGGSTNTPTLTRDKKIKVVYCHDNEGNLLEIVEVL